MTSPRPHDDRIEGIERAPRRRQYENIPLPLIRDARLSYRALGVLTRLLSNADGFRMNSADLARERKEGRDAVRAALRELEDAGYIVREKRQNTRGQWSTVMVVSEEPSVQAEVHSAGFQASVFQSPVFRASENQALKSSITTKHHQESEKTTTTVDVSLDWSAKGLEAFTDEDRVVVVDRLKGHDRDTQQAVLDELAGHIEDKAVKNSPMGLLVKLAAAARSGGFVLNRGRRVRDERIARESQNLGSDQNRGSETPFENARQWAYQQFHITGDRPALEARLAEAAARWPEEASKSPVEASAHGKRRVRVQPRQNPMMQGVAT